MQCVQRFIARLTCSSERELWPTGTRLGGPFSKLALHISNQRFSPFHDNGLSVRSSMRSWMHSMVRIKTLWDLRSKEEARVSGPFRDCASVDRNDIEKADVPAKIFRTSFYADVWAIISLLCVLPASSRSWPCAFTKRSRTNGRGDEISFLAPCNLRFHSKTA